MTAPSMPVFSFRLIVSALVVAVALAGCGESADEAASEAAIRAATGERATVERNGDVTTISTEDGAMKMAAGDDLALPDDFPTTSTCPTSTRCAA